MFEQNQIDNQTLLGVLSNLQTNQKSQRKYIKTFVLCLTAEIWPSCRAKTLFPALSDRIWKLRMNLVMFIIIIKLQVEVNLLTKNLQ